MAYGEIKRNKAKVEKARTHRYWQDWKGKRDTQREFNVSVQVSRSIARKGEYTGVACVRKGTAGAGSRSLDTGRALRRCASGGGATPTKATKSALRALANRIK